MITELEVLNLKGRLRYLEKTISRIYAAAQGSGQNEQPDLGKIRNLCRWALGLDVPYVIPNWLAEAHDELDREARLEKL